MHLKRLKQVLDYGWLHAGEIAVSENNTPANNKGMLKTLRLRIKIFFDILYCFLHYKMWSNQYKKEKFYLLPCDERETLGRKYKKEGIKRDEWQEDFIENRNFLVKYTNIKYELSHLREKRNKAYAKRFNAGKNLFVEYNVNISRQHYLDGSISIGENVLLAKNVFIDYSGDITIKDNVQITNGVIIETHHHAFHSDYTKSKSIITPSSLIIEEGAVVGSRAIILDSCNYIGKNARIGAGAVVTKDVPDFCIVVGAPARIIKIQDRENSLDCYSLT